MAKQPESSVNLADWLAAEAVRRTEEDSGRYQLDDPATLEARGLDAPLGRKIVHRARHRPEAAGLSDDIQFLLGLFRWSARIILLAGFLAGIAAARAVLAGQVVPLSWALLSLVAVPLAFLAAWAILSLVRGRAGGAPGRVGLWVTGLFGGRWSRRPLRRSLLAALADHGARQGSLMAARLTHAFWSLFFLGALTALMLAFVGLRFEFEWGTTLLDPRRIDGMIAAIAALPALLPGLAAPEPAQIARLLETTALAADRAYWSRFLLAAIVLYGLLPRLVLLVIFWRLERRARRQLRLDPGLPGYARLLPALQPESRRLGTLGTRPPADLDFGAEAASAGNGPPVLVGLELGEDCPWPPRPQDADTRVMGRAEDRRQFAELEQVLAGLEPRPRRITVVCALARTPDRGIGAWLARLKRIAPVELTLCAGADSPGSPGSPGSPDSPDSPGTEARTEAWAELAARLTLAEPRRLTAAARK